MDIQKMILAAILFKEDIEQKAKMSKDFKNGVTTLTEEMIKETKKIAEEIN